jgi:arylformamidase
MNLHERKDSIAVSRRRWMAGAVALSVAPVATPAIDYDEAFDVLKASPNLQQVTRRYVTGSEAARLRIGSPLRFAYGPTDIEALDVYQTHRPNAPINIFLHGGAFNMGLAKHYAFAAEMFVRSGAHLVVPDFARAKDVGGTIMPLVEQVRGAVAWVHRNAQGFGGSPERIYVSGHSSGGALAGMLLITDWRKQFGLPVDTVKGGLCCSGTYDMYGFRHSSAGAQFKFTDDIEQALSPMRYIERVNAPVVVAYGSLETAWFQNQSRDFAAALRAAGKPVQLIVAEGYNHFEVIETLANPYGVLGRAMLELVRISA